MEHELNIKRLRRLYPKVSRSTFDRLYYQKLMKTFTGQNHNRVAKFIDDQNGGNMSRIKFKFTYNETEYELGVETIESDEDPGEFSLYFLSYAERSLSKSCAFLKIYHDSNVAIVMNLNNQFECLHESNQRGRIVLTGIIDYCRKHRDSLHIDRLQLEDESEYYCPSGRGRVNLIYSNQLLGEQPFYLKMGFSPVDTTVTAKIRNNISNAKMLTVDAERFIDYLNETLTSIPTHVTDMLIEHNNQPVTLFLRKLARFDCNFYSKIYKKLFNLFELEELNGDENLFEYIL